MPVFFSVLFATPSPGPGVGPLRACADSLIAGPWARSWGCRDEADTLLSCSPVGRSQEAPWRVRLTWGRPRVAISQTLRERREGRGLARRRGHLGWIWAPPSR